MTRRVLGLLAAAVAVLALAACQRDDEPDRPAVPIGLDQQPDSYRSPSGTCRPGWDTGQPDQFGAAMCYPP